MKKGLTRSIPFVLIFLMLAYSWWQFAFTPASPTWRNYVAPVLTLANAAFYFRSTTLSVWVTGIILTLGTFNLLSFFAEIDTYSITILGISSPDIQYKCLALFAIYLAFNYNFLINRYLDFKEHRATQSIK